MGRNLPNGRAFLSGPACGRLSGVPMRQDCKHFESRTYPNGETVRKCDLDLAPEAPWRCPADCPKFARRLADVNWSHGSLVTPPTPDEPLDALDRDDGSVAAVLDEAEDFLNSIGAQVLSEVQQERGKGKGGKKRFGRKRR
jgi:hypothetical protein